MAALTKGCRHAALILLAGASAVPVAGAADTIQYRAAVADPCSAVRCETLGYAVPRPVDSQAPVAGFRSYASLLARLQALALASDAIAEQAIGRTRGDRAISAFVLSDADATTREGLPEPALLMNGGIHAREWASPEVVAGLAERFAANQGDAGLYRYLLDNARLTLIPVLNVDGFLQTQRFADGALTSEFPADPPEWPRDGRMRRKNMLGADEDLDPGDPDFMQGVDPNRNNDTQFFGNGNQNSADARSLVHHGAARGSEPEVQALYEAARLAPANRLRMYIDTHSFSRLYFAADTGNARHDALQRSLWMTMSAVTANRYTYGPSIPNTGIGSTDEYFAYVYQIPAYTLEIEPRNGASEYGGFGVSHDGFVLPASEIGRVRDELADATVAGFYRMAGPPSVRAVQVRERDSGSVAFAGSWLRISDSARRFEVTTRTALRTGVDYTLWIAFSKPMRVRDPGSGAVAQYRGQSVVLTPQIEFEGVDASGATFAFSAGAPVAWRNLAGGAPAGFLDYADDAAAVDFRIADATPVANARRLNVKVDFQDLTGQRLDANPATVVDLVNAQAGPASGGWLRYENSDGTDGTDVGGVDRSIRFIDDGSPLFGNPAAPAPGGGGGGGALAPWVLLGLWLLRRAGTRISALVSPPGRPACARVRAGASCARGSTWALARPARRR